MKLIQIPVEGFDNNFTYLVIGKNKEAFLIDATGSLGRITEVIQKEQVTLIGQLLTHSHPDHCELVNHFSSQKVPLIEFTVTKKGAFAVEEKEIAGIKIKAIYTPGHLHDAVCFHIEHNLITGDTLFVKGVGTTAYGGNDKELEETLAFLSTLDKSLTIWPGHNYGGNSSTLEEALSNSQLRPSQRVLELIKKKVEEYEKKFKTKY